LETMEMKEIESAVEGILFASGEPVQTERICIALDMDRETVEAVKNSVNPSLNVLGILLTKYSKHTNLAKDVLEMAQTIAEQAGSVVFDAKIRTSVAAAEA